MLSNNKKILLISTLIFTSLSIGGVVNAAQTVVNAKQTAASPAPTNSKPANLIPQHYQFPAANALPEISTRPQTINTAKPTAGVARPQTRMAPPPYPMSRNAPYPGQNRFAPPRPPQYNTPNSANAFRPNTVPMTAPFGPRPGSYGQRQRPYNSGPYNSGPYNSAPYNSGSYNPGPYGQRPYGQRPYNNNNSGPFGNNPMDNFGFGPFSKNSNEAPWETWPFGGRDSLWNRREIPFKDQNPTDWFQPGDPKEGMAIMWDDLISAPDELGEMPGGWQVPSISTPNPVDLEDQLEKASKEIPDLIRIYN